MASDRFGRFWLPCHLSLEILGLDLICTRPQNPEPANNHDILDLQVARRSASATLSALNRGVVPKSTDDEPRSSESASFRPVSRFCVSHSAQLFLQSQELRYRQCYRILALNDYLSGHEQPLIVQRPAFHSRPAMGTTTKTSSASGLD